MSSLRNSAKAIIIQDEKLLVIKNRDPEGDFFILPGGGQDHSETLHDALRRECKEEIGAEVTVGRLIFIREYIGKNHEFAKHDSEAHQVEFMFHCDVEEGYSPIKGNTPDVYQTGVCWLPLEQLDLYRLYPSVLNNLLTNGANVISPIYLGDVN